MILDNESGGISISISYGFVFEDLHAMQLFDCFFCAFPSRVSIVTLSVIVAHKCKFAFLILIKFKRKDIAKLFKQFSYFDFIPRVRNILYQ